MPRLDSLATRWLGVGLASILAVVTIGLWATGRLALYVNPDSAWFAVGMAVLVLVGAVASFTLPLGAEADHGHDHGDVPVAELRPSVAERRAPVAEPVEASALRQAQGPRRAHVPERAPGPSRAEEPGRAEGHAHHPRRNVLGLAATVAGGVAASGIVLLSLVLPPASLSAELAMSRDVGAPPLFAGADAVALATTGDTGSFGIGEWAAVFATATNPEAFDGDAVTLTGFVTPGDDGFDLTRLVITHCVIDAQSASIPVTADTTAPATGEWVTVTGTVRATTDGRLSIDASTIEQIAEPGDPYEY
ncbi:hypothetical protein QL996_16210 [Planococcus sp. APC 4015]|nr:hypothetical protein [Planococcus sp. APC 4015]